MEKNKSITGLPLAQEEAKQGAAAAAAAVEGTILSLNAGGRRGNPHQMLRSSWLFFLICENRYLTQEEFSNAMSHHFSTITNVTVDQLFWLRSGSACAKLAAGMN
jgi:hypothetical protein